MRLNIALLFFLRCIYDRIIQACIILPVDKILPLLQHLHFFRDARLRRKKVGFLGKSVDDTVQIGNDERIPLLRRRAKECPQSLLARQLVSEDFPDFNDVSLFPDQRTVWFNTAAGDGDAFLSLCSTKDCLVPFGTKIQFYDSTADERALRLGASSLSRRIALQDDLHAMQMPPLDPQRITRKVIRHILTKWDDIVVFFRHTSTSSASKIRHWL